MENMNRPITSTEIESVIKNSTNKSPGQVGFTTEFYQTFRKELILWNYSKNLLRQEHFETHSINLIEKLDKGATKKWTLQAKITKHRQKNPQQNTRELLFTNNTLKGSYTMIKSALS